MVLWVGDDDAAEAALALVFCCAVLRCQVSRMSSSSGGRTVAELIHGLVQFRCVHILTKPSPSISNHTPFYVVFFIKKINDKLNHVSTTANTKSTFFYL